jgi:large subunit ribosomal protein L13
VNAEGKTLGRLASGIARVLKGKHKPIYTPHLDTGDYVVVLNAKRFTSRAKSSKRNIIIVIPAIRRHEGDGSASSIGQTL